MIENLAEHSAAALEVAATEHAASIDLNRKSTDYVNAIGQANADLYNLATAVGASKDRTHLNEEGSVLFGTMGTFLRKLSSCTVKCGGTLI